MLARMVCVRACTRCVRREQLRCADAAPSCGGGGRLRTHFKKSQFIVVSLKEGMFNNANVLFRTKFVDGVSTVARTTPGQR
jgi:hypothetical protein